MNADARPPMMRCCQSLYLGGAIMSPSSSMDASVTLIRSWITCGESALVAKGGATYVPVNVVRGEELAEVESVGLLQELDLARVRSSIAERDKHHTRDLPYGQPSAHTKRRTHVDDLAIDFEHTGGRLHLRFESMGRGAEPGMSSVRLHVASEDVHHEGPTELHDKVLSRENCRNCRSVSDVERGRDDVPCATIKTSSCFRFSFLCFLLRFSFSHSRLSRSSVVSLCPMK